MRGKEGEGRDRGREREQTLEGGTERWREGERKNS